MNTTDAALQYEFGPFRLDPQNRALRYGDDLVPLTAKVFDVLLALVERHGQLVSKEDLLQAVWPDTFVGEANLTQAVFLIRKALGAADGGSRYITTIPGRGYRFAAEVRTVGTAAGAATGARPGTDGRAMAREQALPERHRATRRWAAWLAAAASVGLATGAVFHAVLGGTPVIPAGRTMLAVLPFANLTGDAAKEYLSDGFTEEMIGQLGGTDPARLGVIARSSVMGYKKRGPRIDQVARELGVQYVLEGSVRHDAHTVRVAAQLVRARDQATVWSHQYERDPRGLLAIQADIAREIAREIRHALGERPPAPPAPGSPLMSPATYEAYDLHLKGRHAWNTRTPAGLEQAVGYFQQAVAADPQYVPAHAGLADAYALLSTYHLGPAMDLIPKARAAALRALELDPARAEAHASMGLILSSYDWDWPAAEAAFLRAITRDPNYATAHHWYAEFLAFQGRFDEALAASERARRLDPLALSIAADHGAILYFSRRHEEAIAQLRTVLAADPAFPRARLIVYPLVELGRFAEALDTIARWRRHDDTPLLWGLEAYVYGRQGRLEDARRAIQRLEAAQPRRDLDPTPMLAVAYAGMGAREQAIAQLQHACREHSTVAVTLKVDPAYDPLRGDARFETLLRLVGFHGRNTGASVVSESAAPSARERPLARH